MPISFLALNRAELVENILWYVANGICRIQFELIHTEPVRLVIDPKDTLSESDSDSEPDSDSEQQEVDEECADQNSDAESAHENETQDESQDQSLPQDATVATSSQLESIASAVYERKNIESWFESSAGATDPLTRRKVLRIDSKLQQENKQQSDDLLERLTWFIQNYLYSLEQHIQNGDVAELACWLDAWQEAQQSFKDNIDKYQSATNIDFNATSQALDTLDIILPNRRTITKNAHLTPYSLRLEAFLKDNYAMQYIPSTYNRFKDYLNIVKYLTAEDQGSALTLFRNYFAVELTSSSIEMFLNTALLSKNSDDIETANSSEVGLFPLQLAYLCQNIPAVRVLIALGAKLREFTAEEDIRNYDEWSSAPNASKSEIMLAIDSNSEALFATLKQLYIPQHFQDIVTITLHYIIASDKPKYLQCLQDIYGVVIDPFECLDIALNDSKPNVISALHILQSSREYFKNAVMAYFSEHLDHLFLVLGNNLEPEYRRNLIKVIFELLNYSTPTIFSKIEMPEADLYSQLQQKLLFAINAASIMKMFVLKRSELLLYGKINDSTVQLIDSLKCAIYQFCYAHPELLLKILAARKLNEYIAILAMGNLTAGDFSQEYLLRKTQMFIHKQAEHNEYSPTGEAELLFASDRSKRARCTP
jgi:hypothetical protein